MTAFVIFALLLGLPATGYLLGYRRALVFSRQPSIHSQPRFHGAYVALWSLIPAVVVMLVYLVAGPSYVIQQLRDALAAANQGMSSEALELLISRVLVLAGQTTPPTAEQAAFQSFAEHYRENANIVWWFANAAALAGGLAGGLMAYRRLEFRFRARNKVEAIAKIIMILASLVAILTTLGIVLSLVFETVRFFNKVTITEFLFGLQWSPQTALREGQVGSSGAFGAVPLFAGTLLITFIAMCVAVPVGLFSAIYMSEYATPRFRAAAKPVLEILAGIPTVVYGFFAALTVAPAIRGYGEALGLDVASESALAAGLVMGVMIIPFISSLSDDVMNAVPQSLRDGALALGATPSETIRQVVLPAALPGIVGAVLLALSRAIGETMIVVMAAGLAANLTANPLQAVTTVTVQMVTLLVGDQEFDSAKTLAAFALGLLLFAVTLCLNVAALKIVQRYRERYD
jgi:phosphate transport system permease protein